MADLAQITLISNRIIFSFLYFKIQTELCDRSVGIVPYYKQPIEAIEHRGKKYSMLNGDEMSSD